MPKRHQSLGLNCFLFVLIALKYSVPNILGEIEFHSGYSRGGSGALYYVDRSGTAVGGGGIMTGTNLHIDALRSNNIYGKSSTVQTPSAQILIIIKV